MGKGWRRKRQRNRRLPAAGPQQRKTFLWGEFVAHPPSLSTLMRPPSSSAWNCASRSVTTLKNLTSTVPGPFRSIWKTQFADGVTDHTAIAPLRDSR